MVGKNKTPQMVLSALRQIIRAMDIRSRYLAKTVGLTVPQLVVLRAIDEYDQIPIGRIADEVSLSQATVTNIVDRLEQRGLLRRERGGTDRRKVWLQVTTEGSALLAKSPDILDKEFVDAFEKLQPWEQSQILASFQHVSAMMHAQNLNSSLLIVSEALPNSAQESQDGAAEKK
ncbi:MAG: MarR family winged helix-turn-helix transcriptional regulator [Spirochaetales bacterium]